MTEEQLKIELAKLMLIGDVIESLKNQIEAHEKCKRVITDTINKAYAKI
jgi:hypothetical protein